MPLEVGEPSLVGGHPALDLVNTLERAVPPDGGPPRDDFSDGAALLLTVAKYEAPDGKKIQDEAVVPTLQVGQNTDDDQEESPTKGDEPLNKALQLLKAKS